jgi:hypothetical protein
MRMRTWLWMTAAVVVIAASSSGAEDAATKRDRQGPVTVALTLMDSSAAGVKVRAALDTHSGSLDGIALEKAVSLRRPDGTEAPSAVEQATGGGHHRQAVVVFPATAGASEVRIVVKNVGGIAQRDFRWSLPQAR